jgi:hexosaminidase
MGGDECAKNFWEKQDDIKALMQKEKLKDLHEVQSYFVKRVEKIIASKGKKMMGWDEILEGGVAPNAAVMSWRGEKGGIEASSLKHPVVMSPSTYAYLDYNQGEAYVEPPIYASLRLKKTYQFDPVPQGADAAYILGGQANLWTEQIPSMRSLEYMLWPRGLAIAESVWSSPNAKNWESFVAKVEHQFSQFDKAGIKYARTIYDPIITTKKDNDGNIWVSMESEVPNLNIHYSFDETHPDNFYPKFEKAVAIPKDAIHLKVITYRNGKQMGRQIDLPVSELLKRATK